MLVYVLVPGPLPDPLGIPLPDALPDPPPDPLPDVSVILEYCINNVSLFLSLYIISSGTDTPAYTRRSEGAFGDEIQPFVWS